jgi:hypothetical protein
VLCFGLVLVLGTGWWGFAASFIIVCVGVWAMD